MKYSFLKFTLDTETKELYANQQPLPITKGQYDLLLFLLQNPNKMLTKEDILKTLWAGKHVTENSIDQMISKLRKVLNSVEKSTYIKTVYGKGLMFVPEVHHSSTKNTVTKKPKKTHLPKILLMAGIVLSAIIGLNFSDFSPTSNQKEASLLLILSSDSEASLDSKDAEWLTNAPSSFVHQLFNYANIAQLKDYKNKPAHLDRQQYINTQWRLSPQLKVVNIHVYQQGKLNSVELQVRDKNNLNLKQTFTDKSLADAMLSASKWLAKTIDKTNKAKQLETLVPHNSHAIELYLRGVSSLAKGEIDKAEHYLQLCLTEDSHFLLAHLQLAQVKNAQGKQDKALAILDTLSKTNPTPAINVAIETLRGDIYDTQGKYEEARDLYLSVLATYKNQDMPQLNEIRFNLSSTYTTLTQYKEALKELSILENLKPSENPELLAHVFQKKASILQKLGHMQQAQEYANKSLTLFSKLDDLLGEAKLYVTLARISTHKSDYKKSVQFLEKALIINKSLNYKLGVGATINELIYVLMVQGNFDKAWELNQEMQDIALDIDYTAMLQIAKQYNIDISRALKKWKRAELYLQEHLELAQASGNKRAILKNKLLALDLYLDEKKTNKISQLVNEIQKHIDESGEIRLQPRLNKKRAEYYLLSNQEKQAIALLLSTKELAKKSEDGEIIIEINNILANYYIDIQQAQKALAVLEESNEFNPLPYPFLLLKAKAYNALENPLLALEFANECKNTANQWWSLEDERFLQQLQENV